VRKKSRPRLLFLVAAGALYALELGAGRPSDQADHHRYAETVLYPAFISKMNNWAFEHPISDPKHLDKTDAQDLGRLNAARKAWREFDQEMKLAGY